VWSFVGDYRYGWSERQIGFSLGLFGLAGALVMILLLPRIIVRIGEWRTAVIGLTFTMLAAFGYAVAWEGWMVYTVIVVTCLEGLADPPLRSLAAAKVPPSAQGELQGAMTSLFSLTAVITPLLYTSIFSWFTGPNAPVIFGGAPYVLGGIFLLLSLAVFVMKVERRPAVRVVQSEVVPAAEPGE
jgi:DHA1 family tetracycline resistance protein-like MFS transporter